MTTEINQAEITTNKVRVEIRYCSMCRWILRASWMAQEVLFTFGEDIKEVALMPGFKGLYEIRVDEQLIWSRAEEGRFPEAKEIKQRIRDIIAPERSLGHSDR